MYLANLGCNGIATVLQTTRWRVDIWHSPGGATLTRSDEVAKCFEHCERNCAVLNFCYYWHCAYYIRYCQKRIFRVGVGVVSVNVCYRFTSFPVYSLALRSSIRDVHLSVYLQNMCSVQCVCFRPHRMHEMRPIAIDDPVAWASVAAATVLTH